MAVWFACIMSAWAQEDPAATRIDLVLVSTFQAASPDLAADADRLFQLTAERVSQSHPVLPMTAVPRFDVQDYDAVTYMRACPPGQYPGCGLVVGQRAEVDWVVGATLRREPDELDPDEFVLVLDVHLVDVSGSRQIASFGVLVEDDEEALIEGIGQVVDEILREEPAPDDLRPQDSAAARAREAEERLVVANSLAALERRMGRPVRSAPTGPITDRLTRDDLSEYDVRDDAPPWERLGLTEGEYLRYANSGMALTEWRAAGRGRFARVLIRGSVGVGPGPWHEAYTSQVLLSDEDLSVLDAAQLLEVVGDTSVQGDVEVGFGVAPAVGVAFAASSRSGALSLSIDEQVLNRERIRDPVESNANLTTWQIGGRVELAPWPRWRARPTLAVGVARWRGAGTPTSERFPALPAPTAWLVELMPGAELDLDRGLALTLRGVATRAIVSDYVSQSRTGDPLLPAPPEARGAPAPGLAVHAGLLIRIGPVVRPPSPRGPSER